MLVMGFFIFHTDCPKIVEKGDKMLWKTQSKRNLVLYPFRPPAHISLTLDAKPPYEFSISQAYRQK